MERRKLTDEYIEALEARAKKYEVWDAKVDRLCVRVEVSGRKTFYYVYSFPGVGVKWHKIGPAGPSSIGIAEARKRTMKAMLKVLDGCDVQAEHMANRGGDTFADLHKRHVDKDAKVHKSWEQPRDLIVKHALPRWSDLPVRQITRRDVKQLLAGVGSASVRTQLRFALSATFKTGVTEEVIDSNPCRGIEVDASHVRRRVLSDDELIKVWGALDDYDPAKAAVLRLMLLTGQRGGELRPMRREHIQPDGFWLMPGEKIPALGWPGTKNGYDQAVYLTAEARIMIGSGATTGFVFGKPVTGLDVVMAKISKQLDIPSVRPHDLRRSFATWMGKLGIIREDRDRILNHRERSERGSDRNYNVWDYRLEKQAIWERMSAHIMGVIEGRTPDNVIAVSFGGSGPE
jgi:integrase